MKERGTDLQRPVSPREIGDVQRRHAGHLHQAAVMAAVGLEAVLDIAHFLGAVAGLEAVGQDERRRGSPDVAHTGGVGPAVLMDVPAGHQCGHRAAQQGHQPLPRRGIDETSGDLGLFDVAVEHRLVQKERETAPVETHRRLGNGCVLLFRR